MKRSLASVIPNALAGCHHCLTHYQIAIGQEAHQRFGRRSRESRGQAGQQISWRS